MDRRRCADDGSVAGGHPALRPVPRQRPLAARARARIPRPALRDELAQPGIQVGAAPQALAALPAPREARRQLRRSEEHTSELQSLMRISYAVFCLKKTTNLTHITQS